MTLSPSGSDAVVTGHPGRAWSIMLIGGVLGWISGQSWSIDGGFGEAFLLGLGLGLPVAIDVDLGSFVGHPGTPRHRVSGGCRRGSW